MPREPRKAGSPLLAPGEERKGRTDLRVIGPAGALRA
jgi:hypothetical protein